MRTRGRRVTGAALAALSLAALALAGVAAPDARGHAELGCTRNGAVDVRGAWTLVRTPLFPAGEPRVLRSATVDPEEPHVLFATNGPTLLRSDDGGCTWSGVYPVSETATPGNALGPLATGPRVEVERVVVPEGPVDARPHWLVGRETTGRPRILVSDDRGLTWSPGDVGLPLTGAVRALAPARSEIGLAYALVDEATVLVTTDSRTWLPRAVLDRPVDGLVVDPVDENEVWAYGSGGLLRSSDGARTFVPVPGFDVAVRALDVTHVPGNAARISAFEAITGDLRRSEDGGRTFRRGPGLAQASGAAHGAAADDLFAVSDERVVRWHARTRRFVAVSPPSPGPYADVALTRIGSPRVVVRTRAGIELGLLRDIDAGVLDDVGVAVQRPVTAKLPVPGPATFVPNAPEIRVDPGGEATAELELDLPISPRPVDLFFLVDTSSSMDDLIDGLRGGLTSIVDAVAESRIEARYGVAEFRDYPSDQNPDDMPYRLVRALGPDDPALREGLDRLFAQGGGDLPESVLAALLQAATGEGQAASIVQGGRDRIEPGQGAGFRRDHIQIVFLGTDNAFHLPGLDLAACDPAGAANGTPSSYCTPYPGPTWERVLDELQRRGIYVVGIDLPRDGRGESPRRDLTRVAAATGAIAGQDVDCDGDGRSDVLVGAPIVCVLPDADRNLAGAVVGALGAVRDLADVDLVASGAPGVVRGGGPFRFPAVNRRVANRLPFRLTVGCAREQAGLRLPVALVARAAGIPVATTAATVACGSLPPAAATPAAPPARTPPAPPGPPPPPPAPVPVPQLQAQPQPQPTPQSNVQTGLATQERHRAQAAYAGDPDPVDDAELAASALRPAHDPSPAPLAAAAALVTGATAWIALRRRPATATATATATVRRPPRPPRPPR